MTLLETLMGKSSTGNGAVRRGPHVRVQQGERKSYAPGEYLFHERPRLWPDRGRGEGDRPRTARFHPSTSTLAMGATIGEGALLTRPPIPPAPSPAPGIGLAGHPGHLEEYPAEPSGHLSTASSPASQRQGGTTRHAAADQLAGKAGPEDCLPRCAASTTLGDWTCAPLAYYGVQTPARGGRTSPSPACRWKNFAHFVDAFAMVKKAAAQANCEPGGFMKGEDDGGSSVPPG